MMYIEHNPLERQEILRNHVPSSTTAILLAHVEGEIQASTLQRLSQTDDLLEDLRLNTNSSAGELNVIQKNQCKDVQRSTEITEPYINGTGAQSAFNTVLECPTLEDENLNEDQYELLEIEESSVSEAIIPPLEVKDNTKFNHKDIVIEDNADDFEYLIIPAPTCNNTEFDEICFVASLLSISARHSIINFKYDPQITSKATTSGRRRPIPPAIPINGFEVPQQEKDERNNTSRRRSGAESRLLNGLWPRRNNYNNRTGFDQQNHNNSYPPYSEAGNNELSQSQMDILNNIRKFFTFNSSKSQEQSRKRKPQEVPSPRHIKYRKVNNNFPDYIPSVDYDADLIHQSTTKSPTNIPQLKPTYMYSNDCKPNMPQHRSSYRSIEPPKLRKSLFVPPHTTNQLIKNESYVDLEFSDDDEPQLIRGFGVGNNSQTYSMQALQLDEDNIKSVTKPPPPPLLEAHSGHLVIGSASHKPTYAETLKQNLRATTSAAAAKISSVGNNVTNRPFSSSGSSTATSAHGFSGYSQRLQQRVWGINAHSIILQDRGTDERDKYKKLLQQMLPRLYGSNESGVELNKKSNFTDSSQMCNGNSHTLKPNKTERFQLKRPPLSSTINLDDDDVVLTGVTQMQQKHGLPGIIVDDDDLSEIIDLVEDDVSGMISYSFKHKENSALSLNAVSNRKEKLPYVEPVNSLKDRLKTSPHLKDNWLQSWQKNWERKHKNRQLEVTEALKVVEKLSTERKAAETELQEHLRKFQIVDPDIIVINDFYEPEPEEELDFIEFSDQQKARIQAAIYGSQDQVLISKFGLNITRRDIGTLLGHNWLNDEVINFYMNLLTERGEKKHESHGMPLVYAMNTFFVPRLMQTGYSGVKRWTRKVDIFNKDIIPVPVHVGGVHWCMAIIHLKNRTIKYYDSMGVANPSVLKALEQYIKDESLDKRKMALDTTQFEIESVRNVPRQMNGSDCGVFSCMFAEYVTRNKPITFSQANMEHFRHKMILEIVQGELMR